MRIEQLMYLVDISQTKSMSKTAQNFYLTQQGVSDAIKKLETEFQVDLVKRTKYGVLLTDIGDYFVSKGKEMIDIHHQMIQQATLYNNSQLALLEGDLVIMTHPRIYQHILPNIIQAFSLHCPKVRLSVIESNTHSTLQLLTQQKAHIGLVATDNHRSLSLSFKAYFDRCLEETLLFSDNMVVCAARDLPISSQKNLNETELCDMSVVTFDYDLVSSGQTPLPNNKLFTSNDTSLHKQLVEQGLAVGVMSRFEYKRIFKDSLNVLAIPFDKKLKLEFILVINKEAASTPQAEHFISLLKNFNTFISV